jgi:hypothetical protein
MNLDYLQRKKKPLLLILSEARLTNDMGDNLVEIQNYNLLRCDSNNRHTGGVIVY